MIMFFEVNFYGGYILNGNRAYYLTRSQPPLLLHEAFNVYNFYNAFKNKLKLPYKETLATHTMLGMQVERYLKKSYRHSMLGRAQFIRQFKAPSSMKQWMTYEVMPASAAYFSYWTNPDMTYRGWNPYLSAHYQKK